MAESQKMNEQHEGQSIGQSIKGGLENALVSSSWVAQLTNPSHAKYFVLGASAFVFVRAFHRARQQAKGKMDIPLSKLTESAAWRAQNPKAAAYLFTGRAFSTATFLVASGAVLVTSAIASAMNVNSLPEFSDKMRAWTLRTFPALRRTPKDDPMDEVLDSEAQAFVDQVSSLLEQDDKTHINGWEAGTIHHKAQQGMREIGL